MELLARIDADLKQAMIGRQEVVVSTLRLLKSELKNAEISAGAPLDEPAVLQAIRKEAKKRREAIATLTAAGRTEQVASEEAEAAVLEAYLPAQTPREDIEAFAASIKDSYVSVAQKRDFIQAVIAHFGGQADGRTVAEVVGSLLS